MEYLVTWKINIEADNPEEAAVQALITMRDRESSANVFEVRESDGGELAQVALVDLSDVTVNV